MAFLHGKGSAVYLGGIDLSPYLNSAALSASCETADTSTFGSTWTSAIPGLQSATLSTGGFYDPGQTTLDTQLASTQNVVTFLPGKASAVGDLARMLLVTDTSYERSSSATEAVSFSWEALSQAPVIPGRVLHVKGEDTNTTTGSSRDDSAATTTGWTAHLHVFAVDGGSWVVKLQDSADNSSWSDVSSGAFTAATGVTSQRLQSASGATLRRYVRYVATRTGGSSGDGITFALVYGRAIV